MVAWVQRCDDAMPAMAAALLLAEVGDEAGTVGRLGQVGWAVVSVWAGRQAKAGKWLGRLRRGGGHEEVGPEGRARPAGPNGSKGRKYLGQISSGLWSNEI
jgi:hypothetical protein